MDTSDHVSIKQNKRQYQTIRRTIKRKKGKSVVFSPVNSMKNFRPFNGNNNAPVVHPDIITQPESAEYIHTNRDKLGQFVKVPDFHTDVIYDETELDEKGEHGWKSSNPDRFPLDDNVNMVIEDVTSSPSKPCRSLVKWKLSPSETIQIQTRAFNNLVMKYKANSCSISDLLVSDDFANLSHRHLEAIFSSGKFLYLPELVKFQALVFWISQQLNNSGFHELRDIGHCPQLFSQVQQLKNHIKIHNIPLPDLLRNVRLTHIYSADEILDAITIQHLG